MAPRVFTFFLINSSIAIFIKCFNIQWVFFIAIFVGLVLFFNTLLKNERASEEVQRRRVAGLCARGDRRAQATPR
jgi:c-di-AMP phosphodiesterase-like protein